MILETSALIKRDIIFDATQLVIRTGADFIKTSTQNHANKRVGLKSSGRIQTLEQAIRYIQLVKDKMGAAWITPQTLRFGASHFLADIMQYL